MWLPPSCTKEGLRWGKGVRPALHHTLQLGVLEAPSLVRAVRMGHRGRPRVPRPALLGEPPAKIIQHERSAGGGGAGRGKGVWGREEAGESKGGAWERLSRGKGWKDSGRGQRGLES